MAATRVDVVTRECPTEEDPTMSWMKRNHATPQRTKAAQPTCPACASTRIGAGYVDRVGGRVVSSCLDCNTRIEDTLIDLTTADRPGLLVTR